MDVLFLFALVLCQATAINKCCHHGTTLNLSSGLCEIDKVSGNEKWLPGSTAKSFREDSIRIGFPNCTKISRDVLINGPGRREFVLEVEFDRVFVRVARNGGVVDDGDFCVDKRVGVEEFVAVLCPCEANTCVRKCCRRGRVYNVTTASCVDEMEAKTSRRVASDWRLDDVVYLLEDARGECRTGQMIPGQLVEEHSNKSNIFLLDDGRLQIRNENIIITAREFCADATSDLGQVLLCCNTSHRLPAGEEKYYTDERQVQLGNIFIPLVMTGIVALTLTVGFTLWLPELRRNLHQRMVLAHNITLLAHDSCMAAQWIGRPFAYSSCQVIGFFHQATLLSAFFWLNAICVDIALVFSGFHRVTVTDGECCRGRFIWLSIYAWGMGLALPAALMVIEFTPEITVFKPVFDEDCIIRGETATWIFLLGPIGFLLLANCVLYSFTSVRINSVSKAAILSESESRIHARNKENHLILTKLFFIMFTTEGISWTFFFLGTFFNLGEAVWLIHQILHLIAGLLIFIVFCCTRTLVRLVRGRMSMKTASTPLGSRQTE